MSARPPKPRLSNVVMSNVRGRAELYFSLGAARARRTSTTGVKTENGAVLVFTDQCTLGGTGP